MNYLRLLTVAAVCLFAATAAASESVAPGTGALKGVAVAKSNNAPVANFEICAVQAKTDMTTHEVGLKYFMIDGKFPKAKTNDNGEFTIHTLPIGKYSVTSGLGKPALVKDSSGNPSVFEINAENQIVDIGKIILENK